MKHCIGVIGSAASRFSADEVRKARAVGREIAKTGCVLVNGACPGLPEEAAKAAKQAGGTVVGFSPVSSITEHRRKKYPYKNHDFISTTGFGFKGRNLLLVRASDAVISLHGGMGTLNELTIAFDENKVIGLLAGLGGVTELFPAVSRRADRPTKALVLHDSSPEVLVEKVFKAVKKRHEAGEDSRREPH
jgi:uncharacterized protein (TIGR00725 family)